MLNKYSTNISFGYLFIYLFTVAKPKKTTTSCYAFKYSLYSLLTRFWDTYQLTLLFLSLYYLLHILFFIYIFSILYMYIYYIFIYITNAYAGSKLDFETYMYTVKKQ